MNIISIGTAFIAGILSFISPCVLPLVPAYISYITGSSIKEIDKNKKSTLKVLKKSLMFVLGFSTIFILLGITATSISQFLYEYKNIFNKIAGIILIILGINLMWIIKIKWLYKGNSKIDIGKLNNNSFLIGLAFGFGWTPCVGTILAGILVYAGNMDTILQGTILLIAYSLGLGFPFILTALFIDKILKITKNITKHGQLISIITGTLIVILGILIFLNKLTILNKYFAF